MLALLLLPVSGISLTGGQLTIRTLFIVYLYSLFSTSVKKC